MRRGVVPTLLFLLVAASSCQARKAHRSRLFRHSDRTQVHHHLPEDTSNQLSKETEQEECHRAALHKCGQTFLRAHKLLSYLDDDLVAFRTRCGVRTAFFECLKTTRERICGRPYKQHALAPRYESDFRKRLTDALWSTRVCVLGVKSFS